MECAIASGSIALLHGGEVFRSDIEGNPSRAEEVLQTVERTLSMAGTTITGLDSIAVSVGPGSYSGIRIGMATAIGLANALAIPCIGVSSLEAMAHAAGPSRPILITALPVGKKQVAWQCFDRSPSQSSAPELADQQTFNEILCSHSDAALVAHRELLDRFAAAVPSAIDVLASGSNVAEYVASYASL